jgi:hypothetical protein
MSIDSRRRCPVLKDRFAWYEKLLVRAALAGFVGVGAVGMYLKSPATAAGYALFAALAGVLVIYDFLCVYCPYPYEYSSCLFFPPQLLTRLAKRRPGRIPLARQRLFLAAAAGLVLIPQYGLWGRWDLTAAFWGFVVPIGIAFPLHYCRRCRHLGCTLNDASRRASPDDQARAR